MKGVYEKVIKPGGFLDRICTRLLTSRKRRWKSYYRACRRIPKHSPVHGTTCWDKINERRCELIGNYKKRNKEEFDALQKVAGELACQEIVVSNFIMGRYMRRLGIPLK